MASATQDLRLPSQPQGITAHRPVAYYTASRQTRVCEQLAQGCYLKAKRIYVYVAYVHVLLRKL